MTFKEIEHNDTRSVVEMSYVPERCGPEESDLLRSVCLMMRYYDKQYVAAATVPGVSNRFEVTFPQPERPRTKGRESLPLSEDDCELLIPKRP